MTTATAPHDDDVDDRAVDEPTEDAEPTRVDPLADLTGVELAVGARKLGANLVTAITERTADYVDALCLVLWLHDRRHDRTTPPDELLARYRAMKFGELLDELQRLADALTAAQGPTRPASGS